MDLCFDVNNTVLNVRSAAFITYDNQVLVSKKESSDYYSLPGGKVKIGEDSRTCLYRELKEELNYDIYLTELQLVRIVENFYQLNGKNYHEILFIYKYHFNHEYYNGDFKNLENEEMKMMWIPNDAFILMDIEPGIIKNILHDDSLKHIIIKK